jgi:hypothetical protein
MNEYSLSLSKKHQRKKLGSALNCPIIEVNYHWRRHLYNNGNDVRKDQKRKQSLRSEKNNDKKMCFFHEFQKCQRNKLGKKCSNHLYLLTEKMYIS